MNNESAKEPIKRTLFFVIKELNTVSIDIRDMVFGEKESTEDKKSAGVLKHNIVRARDKIEKITARLRDCKRGLSLLK